MSAEERPERFDDHSGRWSAVDAPLLSEIEAERITINRGHGPWGADAEASRLTIQLEFGHRSEAVHATEQLIAAGYDAHRTWTMVHLFVDDPAAAEELVEQLPDDIRAAAEVFLAGDGPIRTFFF